VKLNKCVASHLVLSSLAFLRNKNYLQRTVRTLDFLTGKTADNALVPEPACPFCRDAPPEIEVKLRPRKAVYFENGLRIMRAGQSWNNVRRHIGHAGIVTRIASFYKPVDRKQSYRGVSADILGNNAFRTHAGKGMTPAQNRNSAAFESIERYCAKYAMFDPYRKEVRGSYDELKDTAVHPSRFQMTLSHYSDMAEIPWVKSWSLTKKRMCLLPRDFVSYIPIGSNGLASGNCMEEAILHALFELIERDIYMIMDLNEFVMPDLDVTGLTNPRILGLLKRLDSSVSYRIKYIRNDFGIPAFGMYMSGPAGKKQGHAHVVCSHLDKEIALSRTITEAIQTFPKFARGSRWLGKNTGHYTKQNDPVSFRSIRGHKDPDITANIKTCVKLLEKRGLETFAVNHTIPGIKCAVVRMLVPGLQPIWFREMPYLTDRVFSVPETLGYRKRAKEDLNYGEYCGFPLLSTRQ